jgi:DNA-binding XRE family transcriptional regulator
LNPSPSTIIELRRSLGISQTDLEKRVGASAIAVSRWERQRQLPPSNILIQLGILAQGNSQLCWSFWNLAGLHSQDVIRVLPIAEKRFQRTPPVLQIVRAGLWHKSNNNVVAISFLNVIAAAGKKTGSSVQELTGTKTSRIIAAPTLWCPNPEHYRLHEGRGQLHGAAIIRWLYYCG